MRRYALRDDQWDRIKDILPGREGHVGGTAADNRLFVEAVLFRYRAGVPWRDLPERFGGWMNEYHWLFAPALLGLVVLYFHRTGQLKKRPLTDEELEDWESEQ